MRTGLLIAGIALLALAAGCGGGGRGADRRRRRRRGAARRAPDLHTRGGGIEGRADKLVVQPDGSATLTTRRGGRRQLTLSQDELASLAEELRRAKLDELPERAVSDPAVPDALGHRIVYGGETVTTDDPAMPEQLSGLVATLGGPVDAHEKG